MKLKPYLIAALVVGLLGGAILLMKHQADVRAEAERQMALTRARGAPSRIEPSPALSAPAEKTDRHPHTNLQIMPGKTDGGVNVKTQEIAQAKRPPIKPKTLQDPLAREALSLVGIDLDAEMYWFAAIHDPNLPRSERQDLIDDLNEEGLSDPKHPTLDDLPLIFSRLEILEELVPSLTDEFDWKESYDDLLNLAEVAMGGGKPVD